MVKILLALALLATSISIGLPGPQQLQPDNFEKLKQIPELRNIDEADLKYFFENGPLYREWFLTLIDMDRPSRQSSASIRGGATTPRASLFCEACKIGMEVVLAVLESDSDSDVVFETLAGICALAGLATPTECKEMVDQNAPGVHYIIQKAANPAKLSGSDLCAVLDQASNQCGSVNEAHSAWTVPLPAPKPPVQERPILDMSHPTSPILQLTDVHLDLHYVQGSWANCDSKFLCCRTPPPEGATDVELAGPWGAYRCDAPEDAVTNAISEAASKYKYQFVMLTGDFIHHVMPGQSQEDTIAHNTKVAQLMLNGFPETKVYPVIGNHDSAPTNQFPPISLKSDGHDVSWVYENIADLFATQLPEGALATLRRGGYYSVVHTEGLRLIVLNTNFGYIYNFWLFYKFQDPEGQLDWLAKTLNEAAIAKESVYILGHEPLGSDMWNTWTQQYVNVINHYEGIIRAQFYGHTHWDEVRLAFDSGRPTSVLYVGPSLTPFWELNPAFKVYHVDAAARTGTEMPTWEVLDHEVHSYDLSTVDANNGPVWTKVYTAREAYNVTNLRPAAYLDLFERMVTDKQLFLDFYNNYNRNSRLSPICDDDECRLSILCQQVTAVWNDQSHCEHLTSLLGDSGAGDILPHGLLLLAVLLVSLVINTRL